MKPNVKALTGLRFFAALAVYLSHVGAPKGANPTLANFIGSGYIGVTIFFVLSGFVLSYRYFDDLSRPTILAVWNYFAARFARIYPLYILVLGFVVLRMRSHGDTAQGVMSHILVVQAWQPVGDGRKVRGVAGRKVRGVVVG